MEFRSRSSGGGNSPPAGSSSSCPGAAPSSWRLPHKTRQATTVRAPTLELRSKTKTLESLVFWPPAFAAPIHVGSPDTSTSGRRDLTFSRNLAGSNSIILDHIETTYYIISNYMYIYILKLLFYIYLEYRI